MHLNGQGFDGDIATKAPEQPDSTEHTLQYRGENIGSDDSMHTVQVRSNDAVFDVPNSSIPENKEGDQQGQIESQGKSVPLPPIQPRRFSLTPDDDPWSVAKSVSTTTTSRNSSSSKLSGIDRQRVKIGFIGTLQSARKNMY
ncbi:hypothetical protein DPMN_173451 [Dreissena polymorpha]|uniref:Uncharacterized protein n=1 Tax=Dreissena polymorpha TaxID=45954 RepID=A0A9D4IE79_DREPO|nr:hypothetical protein DPMN_173451 [Dreissena polymorpha]